MSSPRCPARALIWVPHRLLWCAGSYAFYCEDVKKEFVTDFVFKMLKTSALYEGAFLCCSAVLHRLLTRGL